MKIMKKPFVFLAFALACRLACAEISYIEIESCKDLPTITLKKIEDVELLIREYSVSVGFLCGDKLFINVNNTYFAMNMNGFKSISDYKAASAKFKNGGDYYDCLEKGLENETLYYFYAGNKFKSVQDCKDAYKKGFCIYDDKERDEINKFNARKDYGSLKTTESGTYYKAIELGLASYSEYTEYIDMTQRGFKNKSDYLDGKAKNFYNGKTYYPAVEKHYPNYEEYSKASSYALQECEYEQFKAFVAFMNEITKLEKDKKLDRKKAFIYYFISTCIPKGDYSFDVFRKILEEKVGTYTRNTKLSNALNSFLSAEIKSNGHNYNEKTIELFAYDTLKEFIVSADVKPLGKYNEKSGIFTKSAAANADKLEKFINYSAAKQ